jgi:VWFA-related protein
MGQTETLYRRMAAFPLVIAFLAAAGGTQERSQEPELQYEVAVTLKLIQVYVLDKSGKPVTDLNVSDFTVFDNGQPRTVTEFEKHLIPVVPVEGADALEEMPTDPGLGGPPQLPRKFFFLFDLARMKVDGLNESKKAALDFLDTQVRATDEVGILVFSQLRGIALHEYISSDHAKVREIISNFNEMIWGGEIDPFQRQSRNRGDLTLSGEQAEGEAGVRTGVGARSYTALPASIRTERNPESDAKELKDFDFIEEMEELAKALGTIPGYKNVVLFSDGFPRQLYQGDTFIQKNINEMAKEFASASSPIHTVNTDGTRHFYKTADERGDSMLRNLSKLSGGKYFGDVKRYENINQELHTMTGNYYVLGYYTDEVADGKYHELKVEVERKGCKVIAQQGYLNPKPFPKLTKFEKQLRLFDLAMSDKPQFQEPLRFSAVALPFAEPGGPNVVLLSRVPKADLQDVMDGEIELVTLIYEEHNLILDTQRRTMDADSVDSPEFTTFSVSALPPGEYHCRVVIRNLESGRGAVAAVEVSIPEAQEPGMRLYPPLLFLPGRDSPIVPIEEKTGKRDENILSLERIYPLLTEDFTPLVQALQSGSLRIMAVFRMEAAGGVVEETEFTANLRQGDSPDALPVPVSIIEAGKGDSTGSILAELDLPVLKPGDYTLEIEAHEKTSGTAARVTRLLRVK